MKKILLVAAVAVMGISTQAQEFRFGPKAGYSFSTLKYKDTEDPISSDPMHTFYVGGMAEYKISDKFGFQGEVLYSPLGGKSKYNDEEDFGGFKTKTTLGTVLVPVSAKYFITEGFSISAGASFGVILSAKAKAVYDGGLNIPGLELEGDNDEDVKDLYKKLNIAPFIGVEYMLENGLFFDARYNYGISDLAKESGFGKVHNSFAQIGVGFKFGGN